MKTYIKQILLAAISLFALPISAQERPKIVCEGKVWNYYLEHTLLAPAPWEEGVERYDVPGYHFKGTKEKNGKTYNVFRDGEGEETALMRQEGNRVYMYYYGYDRVEPGMETDIKPEFLLYDFDLKPGQTYEAFGYDCSIHHLPKLTVLSVDTIILKGERHIRQKIESEMWNNHIFTVVEGIGIDYGMLHLPQWGDQNACIATDIYHIDNVADADGNMIFNKTHFMGGDAHSRFVSKEKVWHYLLMNYGAGRVESVTEGPSVRFQKDDVKMEGKDYSVLVRINKQGEVTDTVALMRQEGSRVWFFNNEHTNSLFVKGHGNDTEYLGKEILVCDFDANPGDSYTGMACGDLGYEVIPIKVDSVGTVKANGKTYRRQFLTLEDNPYWRVEYIEGIGVYGPEWFFLPYLGVQLAGYMSAHTDLRLDKVTDAEGNLIYQVDHKSGVEEIAAEGTMEDNRMFDLMGREIRNPLPGTVYIQNGRKFIAR